jgi:hypothetical protein
MQVNGLEQSLMPLVILLKELISKARGMPLVTSSNKLISKELEMLLET